MRVYLCHHISQNPDVGVVHAEGVERALIHGEVVNGLRDLVDRLHLWEERCDNGPSGGATASSIAQMQITYIFQCIAGGYQHNLSVRADTGRLLRAAHPADSAPDHHDPS